MQSRRVGVAYDFAAPQVRAELAPDSASLAALEKWRALVPSGGRVLDEGCGVGPASRWLANQGCEVLSLDLSNGDAAPNSRRPARSLAALADMRALPVATASADGVLALFSVTHLPKVEDHLFVFGRAA